VITAVEIARSHHIRILPRGGGTSLSGKIGEMVLFPAVRSMEENTTLVANGFSCRHQIEHFTGVKPKHWVEVIDVSN